MSQVLVVLTFLFGFVAGICAILLGVKGFTKGQREKYPILKRLDGKQLHLIVAATIFSAIATGAGTWKALLPTPTPPVQTVPGRVVESPGGEIVRIEVGTSPSSVVSDGSYIWVADQVDSTLRKINLTTGRVSLATGDLGGRTAGHVLFDGSAIWVAIHGPDLVKKIRPQDGAVLCSVNSGPGPFVLASDGFYVWVGNTGRGARDSITRIRTADCLLVSNFESDDGPTFGTFNNGFLWVSNSDSRTVTKLSSDGSTRVTVRLQGLPRGIASTNDFIWVATSGPNSLVQLKPSDAVVVNVYSLPSDPQSLVIDGSTIWVSQRSIGLVAQFSPLGTTSLRMYVVGSIPMGLATDGSSIWVANAGDGTIVKLPDVVANARAAEVQPAIGLGQFERVPDADLRLLHPNAQGVRIGDYYYVVSGQIASRGVATYEIERTKLLPDGSLDPWTVAFKLSNPWDQAAVAATRQDIYVIGSHPGSRVVSRIRVSPDGSLGPESKEPETKQARYGAAAFVHERFVYVVGGFDNGTPLAYVERAPILSNGSLGAWEAAPSLNRARGNFGLAVKDSRVWILGGAGGTNLESAERADLLPGGMLSGWEIAGTVGSRSYGAAIAIGDGILYLGGSTDSGPSRTTTFVKIDSSGQVKGVARMTDMLTPRYWPVTFVGGSFLYVTGGAGEADVGGHNGWRVTERARIEGKLSGVPK